MTERKHAWPKTSEELTAAGYKFVETARCKGRNCAAEVLFFETPYGRLMPLVRVRSDLQPTLNFEPEGAPPPALEVRYQPHFADCPDARQFQKGKPHGR
jgi:hypothetical protein